MLKSGSIVESNRFLIYGKKNSEIVGTDLDSERNDGIYIIIKSKNGLGVSQKIECIKWLKIVLKSLVPHIEIALVEVLRRMKWFSLEEP